MPEAAVWVVAVVAVYAIGVTIYATFYWPWSRAQRALGRLRKHGGAPPQPAGERGA